MKAKSCKEWTPKFTGHNDGGQDSFQLLFGGDNRRRTAPSLDASKVTSMNEYERLQEGMCKAKESL